MWRLGMTHSCEGFDDAVFRHGIWKPSESDKYVITDDELGFWSEINNCPWCGAQL